MGTFLAQIKQNSIYQLKNYNPKAHDLTTSQFDGDQEQIIMAEA